MFTPTDETDIDQKIGCKPPQVEATRSNSVLRRTDSSVAKSAVVRQDSAGEPPRTPVNRSRREDRRDERREERREERGPESGKHDAVFPQTSASHQITSGDVKVREMSRRRKQATALRSSTREAEKRRTFISSDGDDGDRLGGLYAESESYSVIGDESVTGGSVIGGSVVGGSVIGGSVVGGEKGGGVGDEESVTKGSEFSAGETKEESVKTNVPKTSQGFVVQPTEVAPPTSALDPILALFDFSSYYS